ncbi:MAG: 3-methyl-2-oxobutanoate hydroxymethyltransferase [Candidatus Thermoplasmatota archaeon]|nr:3-methyl-2-oxobutanoate hydroxymethyltransferase [Candidatus Thermoplasmatota archaeon]MCL6090991.1 3-methyl-2-oxobutanoate hydroxymethyltransferase [Candidatus Thermoplasmatota archaeon]
MSDETKKTGKINVRDISLRKGGKKLVMVTAYDHSTAVAAEAAGSDLILVGDSGGMVVMGLDSTRGVTVEDMLFMCKAVSRSACNTFTICDMPFLSYQVSEEKALVNAGRLINEGGADAVKLEGGNHFKKTVQKITSAGIPVAGHLGLMPQTTPFWRGYGSVGKKETEIEGLIHDALELQDAGIFLLVLENVASETADYVTSSLKIPTIGIGSGLQCDGQVLVTHDMLGLYDRFSPRFAKRYRNLLHEMTAGITEYAEEVRNGKFPQEEYTTHVSKDVKERLSNRSGRMVK